MFNCCNLIFLLYFTHISESFIASNSISNINLESTTFDNNAFLQIDLSKKMSTTELKYKEYNDNDSIDSSVDKRFEVRGVSVSPIGFLLLLSANDFSETPVTNIEPIKPKRRNRREGQRKNGNISNDKRTTIFIRVSNDKADEMHCSSPEALTIVQLLSGVDMAGAVLPPQLLQHLVALHCSVFDDVNDDDAYTVMKNAISKVLRDTSYFEASQWQLNQIRYPKVLLKGVKLSLPSSSDHESKSFLNSLQQWDMVNTNNEKSSSMAMSPLPMKFQLECSVDGFPISIPLFSEQLPDSNIYYQNSEYLHKATYSYTPASAAFVALSLALRYHAPISISSSTLSLLRSYNPPCTTFGTSSQLNQCLPQWRSVSSLINQSNGVMQNVQTCFEANKLQGALRIAIEKGDDIAAQKIQEKLKQFDNFDDLPVVKGMDYTDKEGVLGKEDDSWA